MSPPGTAKPKTWRDWLRERSLGQKAALVLGVVSAVWIGFELLEAVFLGFLIAAVFVLIVVLLVRKAFLAARDWFAGLSRVRRMAAVGTLAVAAGGAAVLAGGAAVLPLARSALIFLIPGFGDGAGAGHRVEVALPTWNAWATNFSGSELEPTAVPPGDQFRFFVDLAPFAYPDTDAVEASGPVAEALEDWRLGKDEPEVYLLVIPDASFDTPVDRVRELKIYPQRILPPGVPVEIPEEPYKEMAKARARARAGAQQLDTPEFVWGRAEFVLRALPEATGPGTILAAVIHNGRVIDELSFQVCVAAKGAKAEACPDAPEFARSIRGADSLRLIADSESRADGTLYFFELDNTVRGAFVDGKDPGAVAPVWDLGYDRESLKDYLSDTLVNLGAPSEEAELRQGGEAFYDYLFPPGGADQARAAFERFVAATAPQRDPNAAAEKRSLFVRMLAHRGNRALLLPVGMMLVPRPEAGDEPEYLGFSVRLEMPLPKQQYDRPQECLSRWRLAFPPQGVVNPELKTAREGVKDLLARWGQPRFERMDELAAWLKGSDGGDRPAGVLAVLAHQSYNRLYYPDGGSAYSSSVTSRWSSPSLVILNGCKTGAVGSADFVHRLGSRGQVTAVVMTSIGIDPAMAADFYVCLDQVLNSPEAPRVLARVMDRTVSCLREKVRWGLDDDGVVETRPFGGPWGGLALAYNLVGNTGIKVCPPGKPQRTPSL